MIVLMNTTRKNCVYVTMHNNVRIEIFRIKVPMELSSCDENFITDDNGEKQGNWCHSYFQFCKFEKIISHSIVLYLIVSTFVSPFKFPQHLYCVPLIKHFPLCALTIKYLSLLNRSRLFELLICRSSSFASPHLILFSTYNSFSSEVKELWTVRYFTNRLMIPMTIIMMISRSC